MAQFDDAFVRDPATRAQMAKVTRDFGFEDDQYDWASARVTLETTAGETYTEEELYSPKQVGEDQLAAKFRDAAGTVLSTAAVDRLDATVTSLETVEDVAELGRVVRP